MQSRSASSARATLRSSLSSRCARGHRCLPPCAMSWGDEIFSPPTPDWKANQAEAVRSSCTNEERDVFVAVASGRPVGFVAVALNAFHERVGVIDIIGVDPDYQRRGISSQLTEFATGHMRSRGMDIAVVETGGDAGHAPARAAYEAAGFTLLPIARYFRLLN